MDWIIDYIFILLALLLGSFDFYIAVDSYKKGRYFTAGTSIMSMILMIIFMVECRLG